MIRTLRITSVVAVILAAVVLASVLGFLRPASLLHLNAGTGGDKQIEKILSGPSAVDRFKEKFGSKGTDTVDTTPPLVKEATVLEGIINPREDTPTAGLRGSSPLKPNPRPTPPVAVSTKFELLGLSYSSDAKTSLAYIRLPDNTYQWVGPGTEIGHLAIKEIRKNSIVYVDGGRDVEMPVVAPPETASLLDASNAAAMPEPSLPRPTLGAKAAGSPVKPSVVASPKTVPGTTLPSAQISKEEQENLSQLGDRLKSATGAGSIDRSAVDDKLTSEYKSAQVNPTEADNVGLPSEPATGKDTSKGGMNEESRRQFLRKLSKPRTNIK